MKTKLKKHKILITIIIICVVIAGYFGTNWLFKQTYYNPFLIDDIVENSDESANFDVLMATYINMYYPGKLYYPIECSDEGFGKYQIKAKIQEIFDPLYGDNADNITFTIKRSKLTIASDEFNLYRVSHEYLDINETDLDEYTASLHEQWTTRDYSDIQELPESAYLDVSLTFSKYKNAQEVVDFINRYNNSLFNWLALDASDQMAAGVSIYDAVVYDLNNESKEKYPSFYLDEEYTADMLQENVLSRLKVLIDHSDFIDLIKQSNLYYDTMSSNGIDQRYQDIKENGLQVIGIRGCIKKSDLLNMINSGEIYYGYVNDVEVSRLQRK
ncbi:anti sigma factor C-terminal domain-containing protein [uncultured Thomasclavelia sp.]|uniref:anti sigma factor C-terminal domain-containing protein n=1 Tax=uncultured Thomasclavelia sp. TaxID=3025759 RepID=UPI0026239DEC|nr:anti sigma factor C-terminal domain-containing protein [uncultured Thomasclavelia sp.]